MSANFFFGCKTSEEVRQRYDELSRVFNPATYGDKSETISTIYDQYDKLMVELDEAKSAVEAAKAKEKASVEEKIEELREKIDPSGLLFETCGSWLWLTGKTYQVKDTLKELGFRYSPDKLAWYYRQEDDRSINQEPMPLETIRSRYGSKQFAFR